MPTALHEPIKLSTKRKTLYARPELRNGLMLKTGHLLQRKTGYIYVRVFPAALLLVGWLNASSFLSPRKPKAKAYRTLSYAELFHVLTDCSHF